jgi:hypothetical protein
VHTHDAGVAVRGQRQSHCPNPYNLNISNARPMSGPTSGVQRHRSHARVERQGYRPRPTLAHTSKPCATIRRQRRASEPCVNVVRQRHSQRRGHSQRQGQRHAPVFKRQCESHGHGHTSASTLTASSASETKLSVTRPSQRRSLTAMRRRQSPTSDVVLSRHASRPDVNADARGAC